MLKERLDYYKVENTYLEVPCETHACEERCSSPCKCFRAVHTLNIIQGSQATMFALDKFLLSTN